MYICEERMLVLCCYVLDATVTASTKSLNLSPFQSVSANYLGTAVKKSKLTETNVRAFKTVLSQ